MAYQNPNKEVMMANNISLLTSEHGLVETIARGMFRTDSNIAKNLLLSCTKEGMSRTLLNLVEKKCKYAIHALMVSLVTVDCFDVLDTMSAEQLGTLKKLIDQVKQYPQPDGAEAKTLADKCYDKNIGAKLPRALMMDNEITRLSACIAVQISDSRVWGDVVTTLNKWSDSVAEYQPTVYVVSDSKDDVKPEPKKIEAKPGIKADDNHWPLEKLMAKLGINSAKFRRIRDKITKNNPELRKKMNSWFCHETGTQSVSLKLFNAEHFDEMRELIEQNAPNRNKARLVISIAPAEKETWSMEELAQKLGRGKQEVINDKFRLERSHPELKPQIESWFAFQECRDNRGRKRKNKVFVAEHFDEFAKLLGQIKRYKVKNRKTELVQTPKQGAVEQSPGSVLVPEHPTDQAGIIGLQACLAKWQEMLQIACDQENAAEREVAELEQRIATANAKVERAKSDADVLRQKIEQANALLVAQMAAQKELEAAQKAFDEKNAEIAKLLGDINSDKK